MKEVTSAKVSSGSTSPSDVTLSSNEESMGIEFNNPPLSIFVGDKISMEGELTCVSRVTAGDSSKANHLGGVRWRINSNS
jgi:hypothetical protein